MKKRNFAMNKIKAIAFGAIIFALLACEQPFKAGLGPVVDVRDPTLTLDRPGAGSYIYGRMQFSGTAEDDYILSKVEIKVVNRPDVNYLKEYTPVTLNKTKQNYGVWSFTLITKEPEADDPVFPDGDLKIRLKVTDSVGKWTETDEIVFNVKNKRPAISVTAPNIKQGYENGLFSDLGYVGGGYLNYYGEEVKHEGRPSTVERKDPTQLPAAINYPRKVDKKTYLTGSITDDQGIYTGPVVVSADPKQVRFPPQYRIWQVVGEGANNSTTFLPGVLPTESQFAWKNFDQQKEELIALTGAGNYMFAYELPDTPGSFWGFEIRAHSIDNENTKFHYPRSYDLENYHYEYPNANDKFDKLNLSNESDWKDIENRYVLVYIKAPEATPVVDFYALEDIFGTPVEDGYGTLTVGGVPLNDDQAHVYVNKLTVNKSGPFTLRVRGVHQEGILRAEVYWQREGSTDRGRFIWDPANANPSGSTGWDESRNVSASEPYSHWGYNDQLSVDVTRNFVFTYNHNGNDRIPNTATYHELVRGRSKIQRYTGTDDEVWKNKHNAQNAWSYVPGLWEDMARLEEGVYNIEVYATSTSLTGMPMPATRTVRLDWGAPELELITIEGEYGLPNVQFPEFSASTPAAVNPTVVNGVIQPNLLISDSRVADSGIRTGTQSYFNAGGVYLKEQIYLLIEGSNNTPMENLIKSRQNWWPTLPGSTADTISLSGITVRKHGLVLDGKFRLKTTKIYDTDETGVNAPLNNGDYWLYVFARDNAFNVKYLSKKLVVWELSDVPQFDFNVGTQPIQMVTEPGYPDDNNRTGKGFYPVGSSSPRNLLGANQEIKIKITDDDSLDLGVSGGAASGIKIEFSTSKQSPNGDVQALNTQELNNNTIVKQIFGTQPTNAGARLAVKTQTGTIEQKHLPGAAENGGRLPDGIYRLKVTVPDYRPLKLKLDTDTSGDPVAKEDSQFFWFAVNDNPPEFGSTITPPQGSATLADLRDTGVQGTVSTANGPIKMSYTLTRGQENVQTRELTGTDLVVNETALDNRKWEVNFTAKLALGANPSGTYTLRLTATDRFGKSSTLTQQYTIDMEGPVVTIRAPLMQTVDRSNASALILANNNLNGISAENLRRLANGVVSITLRAVDISGVRALRYWLLADGVTLSGWGHSQANNNTSRYGTRTGASEDYSEVKFHINTVGLNAGVYNLYALAEDNVPTPNYTPVPSEPLQTIYVDQNSDFPFFGDFGLGGRAVGSGGAVITGTIEEDDGFQNTRNDNSLRANSIKVWMSNATDPGSFTGAATGDNNIDSGIPAGYRSVTIPVTAPSPLTSVGNGKNIGLNINLETYFSGTGPTDVNNMFSSDGRKHVIIQATDTPSAKLSLTVDGPDPTEQKYRRQYFNFMYDNKPPVINITTPVDGTPFGGSIATFTLVGYIQDANLVTDASGNYYFRYRLNDDINTYDFTLGQTVGGIISGITTVDGERRVSFNVTDSARINELLYQTAVSGRPPTESTRLQEGNNTLWIIARDESGKETRRGIKFSIDLKGPNTFLSLKEVKLEDITKPAGFDWWTPSADTQEWYRTRRSLLDAHDVPVIQRAATGAFYIDGTFVDDASYIAPSFRYKFDGAATWTTASANSVTYLPIAGTASKNARWQVDISTLSNGLHTIQLEASDIHPNNTRVSENFAFRINSGQPTVDFSATTKAQPNVFGRLTGQANTATMFQVSGTATSPNLENVNLIIRHTGGHTPVSINLVPASALDNTNANNPIGAITNGWTFTGAGTVANPLTENLAWTLNVTRGNLNTAGDLNTLREGTYEVAVVSNDMYGGLSDEAVWTFTVDKTGPQISYSKLTALSATAQTPYTLLATPQQSKTLMGDNPTVSGRIQDSLSNLSAVQRQIRRYNYGSTAANGTWQFYNFTNNTWVDTDVAATWATVTVPTAVRDFTMDWDLKSAQTANGLNGGLGANMVDGFYSVRLRAKDSSAMGGNANWDANTGTGDTSSGTSNGNPVTTDYLYFFYANNTPDVAHVSPADSNFSSPVSLGITATNADVYANRFHTLDVRVETINTSPKDPPSPFTLPTIYRTNNGSNNGNWNTTRPWPSIGTDTTATVSIPFPTATYPEGRYRVYFTVTDLAGRFTTINRVIYLDNGPPEGTIDNPRFVGEIDATVSVDLPIVYHYASEIQNGGEAVTINGTASDISGIKEIWFHLGYGQSNSGATAKTGFPTKEDIAGYWGTGTTPQAGSAWFKYDKNNNTPAQFPNIDFAGMDASFLSKWSFTMTMNAIEYYAGATVTVNGRTYNNYATANPNTAHATGPWMVRPIPAAGLPTEFSRSGLYSLPLYVRIVDNAGNVEYIQRDIWIYPNGDYPSATIINPTLDTNNNSPRGGQINFEGMANDNVSVRRVIYRVKADNYTGSEYYTRDPVDGVLTVPEPGSNPNSVIGSQATDPQIGPTPLTASSDDYDKMNAVYKSAFNTTNNLAGQGWYFANLESQEYGQSVPWNFTLNAGGEFDSIIKSKGFLSTAPNATPNPDTNDTVRLWIEMFVFDDTAPRANVYKLMSLGDGTKADPKPVVRVFYLKSTSPKITGQQLSSKTAITSFANYDRNNATRRGQFAIQASLSGEGSPINQISVRLQQDTGALSGWRDARVGLVDQDLAGITITPDTTTAIRVPPVTGAITGYEKYTITYQFDTTGALANHQAVRRTGTVSDWAASGGRYTVDIRIRDNNNPAGQDMYTFEIGVDNYAPFADQVTQVTNTKVAGSNVAFEGRVFDYQGTRTDPTPPYRGIQEVRVWFTEGRGTPTASSVLIDPNGGTNTATLGTNYTPAWTTRTANISYASGTTTVNEISGVSNGTQTAPVNVRYPTTANAAYVKVLNETTAGVMENRITWQPTQNHDIYWSFIATTITMPDGWITMHYLVEDIAGNVSYYTQEMVVMNRYPQITDLVLFTNNTGTGAVFTTHEGDQAYSQYRVNNGVGVGINNGETYLNSGFISKNSVIGFGVRTQAGTRNFPLSYQALYVQRYRIPLTNGNLQAMATNRNATATLNGVILNGVASNNVGGFVNLYTIEDETALPQNVWKTLGVREASPAKGNHFVFQPSTTDTNPQSGQNMNYPNAYVYGYRQVFTPKNAVTRTSAQVDPGYALTLGSDTVRLDVLPSDDGAVLGLNYSNVAGGTTYFNTNVAGNPNNPTTINEFRGSQPDKDDWKTGDPAYNSGNYNYANDTAFFIIKVWDDVGPTGLQTHEKLYDAVVVGMNVYLTDTTPPVARVYDLNPYTETAVSGNNINDSWRTTTRDNAAAPLGLGQNILRGGLYNVRTEREVIKSGHIEPRNNTTALNAWYDERNDGNWTQSQPNGFVTGDLNTLSDGAVDRVSGKIILRGKVWDNQLINTIGIRIGGGDGAFTTILSLQDVTENGQTVKRMRPFTTTTPAYAVEELHWKTGHTVEWAYIWDTETSYITPTATNVRIELRATDSIGGANSPAVNITGGTTNEKLPTSTTTIDTTAVFHNDFNVLVVPYVVGFERQSKFATTRSLQGWYSFFQNETGISLLGYNLGTALPTIQIRTAAGTALAMGTITNTAGSYPFARSITFTIPNAAISGKIEVLNAGATIAAYNHTSPHTNKSWNTESSANQSGSGLWINKPYAHIWRTQQSATTTPYTYFGGNDTTESASLSSPSMTLAYANENTTTSGSLHGAWSIYGTATLFYGSNGNAARTRLTQTALPTEPYVNPDISIFEGMYNGGATQYTANVVMAYQADGTPSVQVRTRMDSADNPYQISAYTYADGAPAGMSTQRWRNVRIAKAAINNAAANANIGRAYVTAYDSVSGNLWFGSNYGIITTPGNRTRWTIDGGDALFNTDNAFTVNPIAPNKTPANVGALAASAVAGEYSAVDYDAYGPVIAYYDQTNDTLRLAYGSIANNSSAVTDWGRQYVIPENHATASGLRKGSGKYVSIKVDRLYGIHLAFYNSNLQTVVYAYAPARASAAANAVFNFNTIHTVDNVVQGGMWTDIAVDNYGNPWITYAVTSRTGNYDGVRMAYKSLNNNGIRTNAIQFTRSLTCPVTGANISNWEALTMPANYTVNNDRLNIEAWPPSNRHNPGGTATAPTGAIGGNADNWNAAIGYGSDAFRIGYFYVPTYKETASGY